MAEPYTKNNNSRPQTPLTATTETTANSFYDSTPDEIQEDISAYLEEEYGLTPVDDKLEEAAQEQGTSIGIVNALLEELRDNEAPIKTRQEIERHLAEKYNIEPDSYNVEEVSRENDVSVDTLYALMEESSGTYFLESDVV